MNHRGPYRGNRRTFREELAPDGRVRLNRAAPALPNQPFRPLPAPTGASPFHLNLDEVLAPQQVESMTQSGRLVLHVTGDTGGIKSPESQQIVDMHMEEDVASSADQDKAAFLYHLGDVVYYYGEASGYYGQFYEPYIQYPGPILAIPGNHDGDVLDPAVPSLDAFAANFCATEPHLTPEAGDSARDVMTQPNVYWTLEAGFATFIGLYTNVPEGGQLEDDQKEWLVNELKTAPTDRALLVATHHPPYSLDIHHSGSQYMLGVLDEAVASSGRQPDVVLAGHVHNYQRFTRSVGSAQVPYLVAGAGGYWHLHYMQQQGGQKLTTPFATPDPNVTLESYCDDRHGFLRLTISKDAVSGQYLSVPRPQESWRAPAQLVDSFSLDLRSKQVQSV